MHLILYCDTTATYILKLVFNVVQIGFKLIASMYNESANALVNTTAVA